MATIAEGEAAAMEHTDEGGEDDLMSKVRNAVTARAKYIHENVETLTMASFRRLLEQDLGIETSALDPHKKQINVLVDQVLSQKSQEVNENAEAYEEPATEKEPVTEAKDEPAPVEVTSPDSDEKPRKRVLKGRKTTKPKIDDQTKKNVDLDDSSKKKLSKENKRSNKRTATPEVSDKSGAESSQLEEDVPATKTVGNKRRRKKLVVSDESEAEDAEENASESPSREIDTSEKKTLHTSESPIIDESTKKEQNEEIEKESEKQSTEAKKTSEKKSKKGETDEKPSKTSKRKLKEEVSDEEPSSDSADKKRSKKVSKAPEAKPQNQLAEQLKRMIKSCGMSVPPSIYKRVKQVPESNRDKALIKELEAILQKEGLNRHSSEKDLKGVKRKKDKQKDLEGIDPGNIINEGRPRRQQTNFYDFPEVPAEKKVKRRKAVVVSDEEEEEEKEEVENEEKSDEKQEQEVGSS